MKKNNSIKFKHGSYSMIITAVVIICAILVNFCLALVVNKVPSLKLDMTSKKLYDFSDEFVKIVSDVKKDINIKILAKENEGDPQAIELIKRTKKLNNKIKLSFVDFYTNKSVSLNYKNVAENSIIIEDSKTKKYKVINPKDYYITESNTQYFVLEDKLAASIKYLEDENAPRFAYTQDHGESDAQALQSIITNSGMDYEKCSLANINDIKDYDFIGIFAPTTDITINEAKVLNDYLFNGGNYGKNIVVFYGVDTPSMPNLDKILKEYGIKVNDDAILDSQSGTDKTQIVVNAVHEKIGADLAKNNIPLTAVLPRSIDLLFERKDITETAAVLKSSDTSYQKAFSNNDNFDVEKNFEDKEGPFNIAALGTKTKYVGETKITSNVFVCTSAYMLSNLVSSTTSNSALFTDAFNYMIERQEGVYVPGKNVTEPKVLVDKTGEIVTLIIIFGVIPLVILAFGIITWIRRKNR